jgi:hypothetical protein
VKTFNNRAYSFAKQCDYERAIADYTSVREPQREPLESATTLG